ncbi:hypothetical protein [Solirubrobacter soli]|uniref:hypothetical protein n=1 Tax=Solirubrobacter soli TaxID=363832 RepID=UPI00042676A4|nr:hypothetical protein [Solirubrobacter soli]
MNVTCTATGAAQVRVRVENDGDATVHVLDGERMPYLIRDDAGLLVLFGVNPPDPEVDYYGVEIPTTRPLEPGATIEHDVSLDPLYLRDHYETQREPTPLPRPVTVRCEVGYGDTPILRSERHLYSIESVIAWQKLASAPPVTLT